LSNKKVIINLGLARCGTTAVDKLMRGIPEISSPEGVKELKYFLRSSNKDAYFKSFENASSSLFFESSPPYAHGGFEGFNTALERIMSIKSDDTDIIFLFNIRNLIKRAFSHYWHDINGHYSIYGRLWTVRTKDDPRRYDALYQKSFLAEMKQGGNDAKFLPEIGRMMQAAVQAVGAENVKIAHTANLNKSISALLHDVSDGSLGASLEVPRLPGTKAPAYLHGGEEGQFYSFKDENDLYVPAQTCLLFARRHAELLSGTDYDLNRIVDASLTWTTELETDALAPRVFDYVQQQVEAIAKLPDECFLADLKSEIIADVGADPGHLKIATTEPNLGIAKSMIWEQQSQAAENDGKVISGRNNRLFLHYDMNQVIPQHTGEILLSDEDTQQWCAILKDRTTYCTDKNLPYAMMFAPDTHAVCKDDIPLLDGVESIRPVLQILNAYEGDNLYYPLKEMQQATKHGEVCQLTDSHWSPYGAYVAYKMLLTSMQIDTNILQDEDITLEDQNLVGDLGNKFTPPRAGRTTQVAIKAPHSEKVWNNGVLNQGHMSFWRGQNRALPSALLITDSYGWKFQRFLAESTRDLFVVHSPLLEKDAIARFQPDFVISLQAERFAFKVPTVGGTKTAIENAQEKSPGAEYPDFTVFDT